MWFGRWCGVGQVRVMPKIKVILKVKVTPKFTPKVKVKVKKTQP